MYSYLIQCEANCKFLLYNAVMDGERNIVHVTKPTSVFSLKR